MCSKIKCLFTTTSSSGISEAELSSAYTPVSKHNMAHRLDQFKIKFKNKYKLLTGIDEHTTFNDLKLAILISLQDVETANGDVKSSRKIKSLNHKDYCICKSTNNVEKLIHSNSNVQNEIRQLHQEQMMLGDEFKIVYTMRLKKCLQVLKMSSSTSYNSVKRSKNNKKKVAILQEFMPPSYIIDDKLQKTCDEEISNLDGLIEDLDKYIDERKDYIKLLEQYLNLCDSIELDAANAKNEKLIKELDSLSAKSTDTGFDSARSSISSFNDNQHESTSSPTSSSTSSTKFKYISRFETYV